MDYKRHTRVQAEENPCQIESRLFKWNVHTLYWLSVEESAGDPGLIPGSGGCPGGGKGNPLQCPCLEKPLDRGPGGLQAAGCQEWDAAQHAGVARAAGRGRARSRGKGLVLTFWNCLKGTNWTMSLTAASPDAERRLPPSPSRNSMAPKSAPPTPTMMMDMGSLAALTIACLVSSRSVITPSVMIRSTKYCCQRKTVVPLSELSSPRRATVMTPPADESLRRSFSLSVSTQDTVCMKSSKIL